MPKFDVQILPHVEGEFEFEFIGREEDDGWQLLQRLYVLMLSDQAGAYRADTAGVNLLEFLDGGNRPSDEIMDSMLSLSCSAALDMLDREDSDRIESFTASSLDGKITCVLQLRDGTVIKGGL